MAKYRYIKRADGRTQKAMVLASGQLRFVKNTGGHAPRKAKKKMAKKKKHSTAIAKRRSSSPRRYHHRKRRSRRSHGGGHSLIKLGGATLGMAYLLGDNTPMPTLTTYATKIPGAKTFGTPAAVGIAALAIDRFVKPNRWLKLLGAAGIVLAAAKIGSQGTNFKWVGDDDVTGDLDDVGDDDIGDDDVGDEED